MVPSNVAPTPWLDRHGTQVVQQAVMAIEAGLVGDAAKPLQSAEQFEEAVSHAASEVPARLQQRLAARLANVDALALMAELKAYTKPRAPHRLNTRWGPPAASDSCAALVCSATLRSAGGARRAVWCAVPARRQAKAASEVG